MHGISELYMPKSRKTIRETDRVRAIPLSHPSCSALTAAGLRAIGLDWRVPGSVWGEGLSSTLLIFWVASGTVALCDGSAKAGPDQSLIIPPAVPKRLIAPDGAVHLAYAHVDLRPPWNALDGGARVVPAARARHVPALIAALADETVGAPLDGLARALAESVLLCCMGLAVGSGDAQLQTERRLLQHVWDEVAAAPALPWGVDGLARRAGMSTGHFHRRVQAQHGRSPMAVVRHIRLERAADLLRTTRMDLATIADEVGYATGFALSHAMQRQLGRRPSQIRTGKA